MNTEISAGVSIRTRSGTATGTVITVGGELDFYTAQPLRDELLRATREHWAPIVIDLDGVTFIDSTGVAVLVAGLKRAKAYGGTVALAAPSAWVRGVLGLTGLLTVFNVYATVAEAEAVR